MRRARIPTSLISTKMPISIFIQSIGFGDTPSYIYIRQIIRKNIKYKTENNSRGQEHRGGGGEDEKREIFDQHKYWTLDISGD